MLLVVQFYNTFIFVWMITLLLIIFNAIKLEYCTLKLNKEDSMTALRIAFAKKYKRENNEVQKK